MKTNNDSNHSQINHNRPVHQNRLTTRSKHTVLSDHRRQTNSAHNLTNSRLRLVKPDSKSVSDGDHYVTNISKKLREVSPRAASKFDRELPNVIARMKERPESIVKFHAADRVLRGLRQSGEISDKVYNEVRDYARAKVKESTSTNPEAPAEQVIRDKKSSGASNENSSVAEKKALGKAETKPVSQAPKAAPSHSSSGADLTPSSTFLWKPVSDSNGNLVILLPAELAAGAVAVQILSPDGQTILATGKFTGVGNGQRPHFRFDKPGSTFPPGSVVQVTMADGSHKQITIGNPNQRTESKAGMVG